jgi:hypothetical protein
LERTDRELGKAIQAILDGVPGAKLKDKIGILEARKAELTESLANAEEPPPLLHPNMARFTASGFRLSMRASRVTMKRPRPRRSSERWSIR